VLKHLNGEKVGVQDVLEMDDQLRLLLASVKESSLFRPGPGEIVIHKMSAFSLVDLSI
jgi:hypothetical protein